MTPAEADILKTVIAGACGLAGAAVTAWAGVAMARLKRQAEESPRASLECKCPSAQEIAAAVFDAFARRTGDVDGEFWTSVRMWPKVQQAVLGRCDSVGADSQAMVALLPQIAAQVKSALEHLAEEKRDREILRAAEKLAAHRE